MRLVFIVLLAFYHCAAVPAHAGAWLRETGTSFSATSFTTNYFRDFATTTYFEHGLRDDMTIGLDIGHFTSRFGARSGIGTLFLRRPLGTNEGKNQWAYELGVGTAWVGDLVLPHVKTGISWGRGIKLREKYGWMAVDASVTWEVRYGLHLTKVDATVGLNFTDQFKGMMQLYVSHLDGVTSSSIAPSFVYKPKKTKFSIQIGAEAPMRNFDNTAVKIGIWREF